MQSSTLIALRALVMLLFLITVPLVAIFGTSLPDVVRAVIEGRVAVSDNSSPTQPAPAALQPAPPFAAPGSPGGSAGLVPQPFSPAPTWPPVSAPPTEGTQPAPRLPQENRPLDDVQPTGFYQGMAQPAPAQPGWAPPTAGHSEANFEVQPQQISPDRLARLEQLPRAQWALTDFELRLQQLGASYYRLESLSGTDRIYRFSCIMGVARETSRGHYFEATERTPELAMGSVLRQVEAWQGDRVKSPGMGTP